MGIPQKRLKRQYITAECSICGAKWKALEKWESELVEATERHALKAHPDETAASKILFNLLQKAGVRM